MYFKAAKFWSVLRYLIVRPLEEREMAGEGVEKTSGDASGSVKLTGKGSDKLNIKSRG